MLLYVLTEDFKIGGQLLFPEQYRLPLAYPRWACAVEYMEVESSIFTEMPQMKIDIWQVDSYREYNMEEIKDMAKQAEEIVSR